MRGTREAALLLVMLAVGANASAASKAELEARIEQLERKLDSRSLMDMLNQVTTLQQEVQQLRGDIEVQNHTLESLQKRQRDLYLDIDRRLHRLEAGGVEGQATAPLFAAPGGEEAAAVPPAPAAMPPAPAAAAPAAPIAPAAEPTLSPADQRKAYDQALELLKEGRYNDAATAFQNFLQQYPDSSYADNAQYWLGEVYYVTRQFQPALTEFDKVLTVYPGSAKAADAKLKMGYIQYELKDWGKARGLLSDVVKAYPGSTSARLAQERLDRMQKEGH
jgi:tol-pal system protein YbgF